MIRLNKTPIPPILQENQAKWTNALLAEIAKGGDAKAYRQSQYNKPEIKDAIKRETNDKCAYCESDPLHVTYGDIEHIIPKSVDPAQTFHWPNLTLACDICNTNKSDKEGYIDPYTLDPATVFTFEGPMILHRPGNFAAERTRRDLKLNRPKLLERRAEKIDSLAEKLERILATSDSAEKAYLAQVLIDEETSPKVEFSACASTWVNRQVTEGNL